MNEKPTAAEWVVLALCVVMLGLLFAAGCVIVPASSVYMQLGGHANAAANTGPSAEQQQSAPGVPASEVETTLGIGGTAARQGTATTQPSKPAP